MPVAPCRTVASPETAQPERPYPTLASQTSADRASLARGSRPPPRDWTRLGRRSPSLRGADSRHFLPGRTLEQRRPDRKSTRLNSSHLGISYAVFCLKRKREDESVLKVRSERDIS